MTDFQKARLHLTLWYLLILFVILNLFTGSFLYLMHREELSSAHKIEIQWQKKQVFYPEQHLTIVQWQQNPVSTHFEKQDILDFQQDFVAILKHWIFVIEGVLLFLAGIFSYFLAGKTLKPIEKKSQQQQDFLADVSHELKNPLSALSMSIHLAQQQEEWKKGEFSEFLSDIKEEISRLTNLTQDLLLLENTEKNGENSQKKEQEGEKILENIIKKLEPLAEKKNILLEKNIENFSLQAEQNNLEKIFWNLLHNAIKFSPPNSTIQISLTNTGKFSVEDEGEGIPKEEQKKIFDRFYKLDSSRTFSEENGSGLGLSLVKTICEKNNWEISVQSEGKEKGSKFLVQF